MTAPVPRAARLVRKAAAVPSALEAVRQLVLNINHYVVMSHSDLLALHGRVAELERTVEQLTRSLGDVGRLSGELAAGRTAEVEALAWVSRSLDRLAERQPGDPGPGGAAPGD